MKNNPSPSVNPFCFPPFLAGQQPQWMQPDFCGVSAARHWVVFHQDPGTMVLYHFPEGTENAGHFMAFRLDIVQFRRVVDVVLAPEFATPWPQTLSVIHDWREPGTFNIFPFCRLFGLSDNALTATLGGLKWGCGGEGLSVHQALTSFVGIEVARPVLPMLRELVELIEEINQPAAL